MKVIFLDIDGVLNCTSYFIERHSEIAKLYENNKDNKRLLSLKRMMLDIDNRKLELLKDIIDVTGAKVVVTSSWKRLDIFNDVEELLISMGIPIVGTTKDKSYNRGTGIKKYLKENQVEEYIVLDDDIFEDYDTEIMNHLVKTSFSHGGLNESHKKKAIELLKEKEKTMTTEEIFDSVGKLSNEIIRLHKEIDGLNKKIQEVTALCPHDIVFKYNNYHPKLMPIEGEYFCPACGKTIRCYKKNQLKESIYANSRIIPIKHLSLLGTSEVHFIIQNEVFNNMNIYYDKNLETEVLSLRMEELLKDHQYEYKSPAKVLKK